MYEAAHMFLRFSRRMCQTLFYALLIGTVANLAVVQTADLNKTVLATFYHWLLLFGPFQIVLLCGFTLFIALMLAAWIITIVEKHVRDKDVLRKYLHSLDTENSGLGPTHIAKQSQALISITVPLDDNFIPLNAVPDRPRYDNPEEQQRQFEELQNRTDLDVEERGKQMQLLCSIWQYTWEEQTLVNTRSRAVGIEAILQGCTATNPVAVILGAPGSGKSTCLRWLALHMSRSSLSKKHRLPDKLRVPQVPILLHIGDYARYITAVKEERLTLSFKDFFKDHFARENPGLPAKLEHELDRGRCLLLLDGLDEVANDELRSRVATDVDKFISTYIKDRKSRLHNRFIITSRIVGYEGGPFNSYPHYTLLELTDEQIEQFLTTWCPAVERHMMRSAKKTLNNQEELLAKTEGDKQRDHLLKVLQESPGIKRLAVNPLMLTILAMLQRNSKTLPHRRIDLYSIITHTLLESWNHSTERKISNVDLAKRVLRSLASELQTSGRYITKQKVEEIVRFSMEDFYGFPLDESENEIEKFIEEIRRTSSLFVESGQGLFSFMHRTFQEYFVAQDLLSKQLDEFQKFTREHCHSATWSEPLLLAIADKVKKSEQDKVAMSTLLQTIVEHDNRYPILHRNLLFATSSIIDCGTWLITREVQQNIANRLFVLYGDSYGSGRYIQLQKAIEAIMLSWLYGQESTKTPLLKAWHTALCTHNDAVCQKGAVHLLASLASDLPHDPQLILDILLPPLLKFAGLDNLYRQELYCPLQIRNQLVKSTSYLASLKTEECALVALHSLHVNGPLGWLRRDWLKWSEEQPELLKRLTEHSIELNHLLTPAAFPVRPDDPNLDEQIKIAHRWKELAESDPVELQRKLLQASDIARYPHAYLFKRLLDSEMASPSQPWCTKWDSVLREEMKHGRSATYQTCFYLRLLIHKDNHEQYKAVINELISSISTPCLQQTQALNAIISIYLCNLRDLKFLWDLRDLPDLRKLRYLRYLQDLQDLSDWRYLQYLRDLRNLRDMLDLRHLQELKELLNPRHLRDAKDLQYLRNLRSLVNPNSVISILCIALERSETTSAASVILLALYSILLNYDTIPSQTKQQIQDSLKLFDEQEQRLQQISIEHHQLIRVITRQIEPAAPRQNVPMPSSQRLPDERVAELQILRQGEDLRKQDIQELLSACNDPRPLPNKPGTVGQFAWRLLSHSWNMDKEAQEAVVQALNDDNAIICAAATLLLRHAGVLFSNTRTAAGEKIMDILKDEERSHRPLDPPNYSRIWRLDDMLFETLQAIAEKSLVESN